MTKREYAIEIYDFNNLATRFILHHQVELTRQLVSYTPPTIVRLHQFPRLTCHIHHFVRILSQVAYGINKLSRIICFKHMFSANQSINSCES